MTGQQPAPNCGAEHPTNRSVVDCDLPKGHGGKHHSWTGCAGSHVEWDQQPAFEAVEAVATLMRCPKCGTRDERCRVLTSAGVGEGLHRERVEAAMLALPAIHDAIHRDGADADAIRQALDLLLVKNWDEGARTWVRRPVGAWRKFQP